MLRSALVADYHGIWGKLVCYSKLWIDFCDRPVPALLIYSLFFIISLVSIRMRPRRDDSWRVYDGWLRRCSVW